MKKKLFLFSVMLLCSVAVFAQNTITGSVVDGNGNPVIGAAVMIPGTTTGASTDIDGKFQLSVQKGTKLEVSSIGYKTQEFTVGDSKVYNIVLEDDSELLEGTVVIGYGTVNRKNFTGSVATYNVADAPVANMAKQNAVEMLRGMAPGLEMTQSGVAGSTPSMKIRGQKSISGGSDPLIVLDGVIFKGSLMDIDPATIESMSVMKDATSLASYGSQAANGVIMITSKKGTLGKPTINFRGSLGVVQMNYKPQLHNPEGYIELVNARKGATSADDTSWMSELELANYKAGKTTDWIDYSTQTGIQQDYSMNISGGTEGLNYMFGAGYSNTENFIPGNKFVRENVTARLNSKINKSISAGLNISWTGIQNKGIQASYSRYYSPYGEPQMPDGSLRKYIIGPIQETATNPLFNSYVGRDTENGSNSVNIGGNIEVKFPFLKGLSYKITGNYTIRNSDVYDFTHENNLIQSTDVDITAATYDKYLSQASGSLSNSKNTSWVLDNILTYNFDNGVHYVNATLVYTMDSNKSTGFAVNGTGFDGIGNTSLGFWGLNNATNQNISRITYNLHTDIGYLARVNYSFKNKYHFNASFRRDGSSVFGENHKWGNFPAVGAAWTVSDEPWMKDAKWLDYLKIKASWGKNGNQSLQPYGTLSRMAMGKSGGVIYYFGDNTVFGQSMTTLGNPNLGWETTTSWNGGFEIDLFNRRIHWETDIYKSKTTDQIFNRTIPVMGSGITSQAATMGRVDNFGIESSLTAQVIRGRDFNWNATLNFTLNRNKLVELYGDGMDDVVNNLFLGESLGAIYGYRFIGIVQESDTEYIAANGSMPGDPKFANIDGSEDGRITPTDREILGFGKEAFRMSFANTLTYKNFSLYVMFNGVFSSKRYGLDMNDAAVRSTNDGVMMYLNTVDHGWWTKENKSQEFTRPYFSDAVYNVVPYGFVRLQDVNLTYTFPKNVIERIHVGGLQLYLSGRNLGFIAPGWKYSDPEVRSFTRAQLQRTFTFGINLRF